MHLENQESDSKGGLSQLGDRAGQLEAEAVRQSQQLIGVLDTINDRVFLKDIQGRVTYVNRAFLKAYGLSAVEVIGKSHEQFLPAEMVLPCQSADQAVLQREEPICLETNWQDDAGNRHWSETHKAPLHDTEGNITGIVGVSRDITARRITEDELKRQKNLLEQIIETVPDWIFVKDRQRRLLLANRSFYTEQGLDPGKTLGRDSTPFLPTKLAEIAYETDTQVLVEKRKISGEMTVPTVDGKEKHLEFRKLPLLEEGEIKGIVSVCRDLTEAKEAEEQSKRNETLLLHAARLSSIGELVAGIAHEVNQPLFSILNYAKAIENALRDDEALDLTAARNWIGKIRKEADRGGKITRRLKSFVKPTETQQEAADLNQVVAESLEFLAMESRDAKIVIETNLAADLPTLVLDYIQIQQVLVNLLKNAIETFNTPDASQVLSRRVLVASRRKTQGAEVSVADNGPGVFIKDGQNILDPFQTTKHDGLGLGLTISKTIIEAHQGELTYHTNDWGGATFCFTLPVSLQEDCET